MYLQTSSQPFWELTLIWFVYVTMFTPDPTVRVTVRVLRFVDTLVAGGSVTSISLTETLAAGCNSRTVTWVPAA